jgi:hypothetical protein
VTASVAGTRRADRVLDPDEALTLCRALDALRIDAAGPALRLVYLTHGQPPRAASWTGALAALDAYADALAIIEQARSDYAVLSLLVPHAALSAWRGQDPITSADVIARASK